MNLKPDDFLAHWYKEDAYKTTYISLIQPVTGTTFWDHEGEGMVLPPDLVMRKKGRRQTARRKQPEEKEKNQ